MPNTNFETNKSFLWTINHFSSLKDISTFNFSILCPTSEKYSQFEAIFIPSELKARIHLKHHNQSNAVQFQGEPNFQVNFRLFLIKGSGERCFLHGKFSRVEAGSGLLAITRVGGWIRSLGVKVT